MKTKILFIEPPISSKVGVSYLNHQVPLGFLYMGGVLEKNGFEVKILDCPLYYKQKRKISKDMIKFGLFPDQIKKTIREFKPDIVGVDCSFTMFESDTFEVIKLVKEVSKDIKLVVGGAHASANPKLVLRNKDIDLVVIGEGELTMLEIAEKVRDKKGLGNIKGTALIVNKKLKLNIPRPHIENLDEYEPAWNLINVREYFAHPDNSAVTIRSPSIHIVTSRGCPGQCVFCSVYTVWGRKWRAVSAKKVVDQIEYFVKNYGVKHVRINDDNITLKKDRMIEICKEIVKRKVDIKWDTPSGVAFWALDEEVIDMMKKSGYYRITFAIESASPKTLKYINKNVDLKKINDLIDYCHKIGLWVASFFIIGFPFENKKELKKTTDYIINSKLNFPFLFMAQPYMGTKMYEDFQNAGLLEKGFLYASTPDDTKYKTKYFLPEELKRIRKTTYRKFYLKKMIKYSNPYFFYQEFLSKIRSFEDLKYVSKVMKILFF